MGRAAGPGAGGEQQRSASERRNGCGRALQEEGERRAERRHLAGARDGQGDERRNSKRTDGLCGLLVDY